MTYRNILVLLFFLTYCFSFSQGYGPRKNKNSETINIYGKISGFIKDKEIDMPLEYASVSLLQKISNSDEEKIIDGTITNQRGLFVFDVLPVGDYIIDISYNGYVSKRVTCQVSPKKLNQNLKNIFLDVDTYILNDVKLSSEAPVYENKIEKIVYNVSNDLDQSAQDGVDVLRNTPLLSVDINDNVSLRGSENIKFLLNGKSSSFLNMDNISDVLQSISADQIKSIEVITSPGAKYDADGDAGVVNIVTDQKNIQGFNAGVNTSTGTRVNRTSFNLNAGKNRFGISASGSARYGWPREGSTTVSNSISDSNGLISRQLKSGEFLGNWIGFRGSMDIYYDINMYNSITANINVNGQIKSNDGLENVSDYYYSQLIDSYLVSDTSLNRDTESELTLSYIKTFPDTEGRELSFDIQYGGHIHDDISFLEQTGNSEYSGFINNEMLGKGFELTGQLDYIHPFGNKNKFELGLKRIERNTVNDYKTETDLEVSWLNSYDLNNIFTYKQKVSSFYVSTNLNFPSDIGVLIGTRYEHTNISGEYNDHYPSFTPEPYSNIVPNMTISKKINMFQTIKISYTNRIKRPDIHKINTNLDITDLNNISRGNPTLEPSNSYQIELGYTNFKPGLMTSFFVYYKKKNNVIEAFTSIIEDNVFETNYYNTGNIDTYGFNFFGSTTIKKILTLRASADIYSMYQALNYKYSFNANLKIGKGYRFESRAFFRSPRRTIQGERPSFSMMSFGLRKDFTNKRGSIGLGMVEPFSKYKSFDTSISGDMSDGTSFENNRDYQILFRSFNINFKYKFGKIDFDPIKKKAILENNDTSHDHGDDQY
ncbi:MAG: hypothetical protein CMD26_04695 [Flavobacteriales bacterium]|nr:hypothetical protein [Flavobacteriales bacterium]|tara:strand:- start:5038 stop:7509 length:2472 start_codon:yes stop_codon:yes gene_type:complete